MWLPFAFLAGGLLVGLVAGGHWRAVRTTQVRRWPLGALGLACTVLPWLSDQGWTTAIVALGWALLIAFAIFNLHLTGMVIIAIGISCNLLVLLVNQAMPVRVDAVIAVGVDEAAVSTADLGPGRRLEEPGDRLEPLTAIIPLPALSMVLTFGDLIALFGLADVAFRLARRSAPRHARPRGRAWAHLASKRAAAPAHPWAVRQPAPEGMVDDWVLDLRETMRDAGTKPALASLAPEDEESAPELIEGYTGQPLPSRR
jgi:Family of unknown function (DUF5317)